MPDSKELADCAANQFGDAVQIARDFGLILKRFTNFHYQLIEPIGGNPKNPRWIINFYPTTCKVFHDLKKPGPDLKLLNPKSWTLLEAVTAAARASIPI